MLTDMRRIEMEETKTQKLLIKVITFVIVI